MIETRLRVFGSMGDKHVREICHEAANEIEALRQQLAECQAALVVKDTALRAVVPKNSSDSTEWRIIAEALAIQPDDSALKAWLGEPVAWLHEKRRDSDVITDAVKNVWNGVVVGRMAQYSIPLYAKPKGIS